MDKSTTDPRPLGVILVHRQSGGPMVDESGRVVVFDFFADAVRFIIAHDGLGAYEMRELVSYWAGHGDDRFDWPDDRDEWHYRPETPNTGGILSGSYPAPCNWLTKTDESHGWLCMLPYGHTGPHDATVRVKQT